MRNRRIKGIITAVLITLLLGIYIVDTYKKQKHEKEYKEYMRKIESIKVEDVDLTKVKDGEYLGETKAEDSSAKVKVIVKNHEIKNIEILELIDEQGKQAKQITQRVLQNQSLDVDTITGATYSSKVILKATEEALKKGQK